MRLFDPNFVYPSDREGGRYIELDGAVIGVDDILDDHWGITVKTEKGDFKGYMYKIGTFVPKPGHFATIRIYDAGGGWYPDNKVTSVRGEL